MTRKSIKISLILGILSFFIFNAGFCLALGIPTLISPENEETTENVNVELEWKSVANADTYEIRYVKTEKECDKLKDTETIWKVLDTHPSENEYTLKGLQPNRRYCWKIKAESYKEEDQWSNNIRSFITPKMSISPGEPDPPGNGNIIELINPLNARTLDEFLNKLIAFLFYLAVAIIPLMVIYSAYLILFSGGDAKKVEKGKKIILWSLVALAIILFAKGLPAIIISL